MRLASKRTNGVRRLTNKRRSHTYLFNYHRGGDDEKTACAPHPSLHCWCRMIIHIPHTYQKERKRKERKKRKGNLSLSYRVLIFFFPLELTFVYSVDDEQVYNKSVCDCTSATPVLYSHRQTERQADRQSHPPFRIAKLISDDCESESELSSSPSISCSVPFVARNHQSWRGASTTALQQKAHRKLPSFNVQSMWELLREMLRCV